jgi:para-nitrobenzyl esterase
LTSQDALTVAGTPAGRVRGAVLEDGLRVWRGIPFAAPPSGPLRFAAPQPPPPWDGVRDAVQRPPVAWQGAAANPLTGQPEELDCSEDCLYLNVTAPAGPRPDGRGYPVLVWVHGGGYVQGSGASSITGDAAGLARLGLIVVTFNYRLGALGFLHLADVAGDSFADAGQAGFLDQVAALRWIRGNIGAFGGDPARVTAYGVSAGAKSVANLLASPLAAGLIGRAISASGGAEHIATPAQGAAVRRLLLRELGLADDASAARRLAAVPPAELAAAQDVIATGGPGTWVWRPVLGGRGIPVLPIDAIAAGAAAGVPLLIGHNGAEGVTYQLTDPTAAGQAPRVLAEMFGAADASAMLAGYAAAYPELDDTGIGVAVLGAERYGIPTYRLALAQAAHAPVWRYRYDGCPPGMPAAVAGGHGMDMLAVWGAGGCSELAAAGDEQARLGLAMAAAWAGFARGEPPAPAGQAAGAGLLPPWPQFSAGEELTMVLAPPPRLESQPGTAETGIWSGRTWPSGTWWQIGGS